MPISAEATCMEKNFDTADHYNVTSCPADKSVGSACYIGCNIGYEFSNRFNAWKAVCQFSDSDRARPEWNFSGAPECKAITCPQWNLTQNQVFVGDKCEKPVKVNSTCRVRCSANFEFSGSSKIFHDIQCNLNEDTSTALWSPISIPKCEGTWSKWSQWSECSTTCGEGRKNRKRFCRGGKFCLGKSKNVWKCNIKTCLVTTDAAWPENRDTNAGFIATFTSAGVGDGSCYFKLPSPVLIFHVLNGHIVVGDFTNPRIGRYKVVEPEAEFIEHFKVFVYLFRGKLFEPSQIDFKCNATDVAELSVFSFPQNDEIKTISSCVFYRRGFKKGDILTITLPSPVDRFNITGGDRRWIKGPGVAENSYTVSGFVRTHGNLVERVHFSIQYRKGGYDDERLYWFSAGEISVAVTRYNN